MNELEITSYLNCTDGRFLDFVGFRNELAMLNTINALLQTRLMAIRNVILDCTNLNPHQRYALMYRQGQEQVLTCVLTKIEQEKQVILSRMAAIKEPAPVAPFYSINNPEYFASVAGLGSGGLITLDSVTITLNQLFQRNPRFRKAIDQLFEDIEEEQDVVMMLALIQERSNGEKSKWHVFFDRTKRVGPQPDEAIEELQGLYDSLFPDFTEAFPDIFDPNVYTFDALVWAEQILNNYSLSNPMVVVPL
ncbi:hypothetical protein BJV82DRAFT_507046 [Fennellomyces sp. T-0311]|nr:hypothetical protein BJV82DRAFT_507046 [Fennellomyces sp. T-0311]